MFISLSFICSIHPFNVIYFPACSIANPITIAYNCLQQSCFSFLFIAGQLPCGKTPISQSRVIGGQDAKPGAWPWQVRINVLDSSLSQYFHSTPRTRLSVSFPSHPGDFNDRDSIIDHISQLIDVTTHVVVSFFPETIQIN